MRHRWRYCAALTIAALIAVVIASGWPAGRTGSAIAASTPAGYLLSAQNSDGGFGPAPGSASLQLYAGWAALGLASAGYNPKDVSHGGQSLAAYISAGASSAGDPGSVERTILALRAAGMPVPGLVAQLRRDIRPSGSVSDQVNLTSFAVLALRAAGVAPPANTLGWIARQEDSDGGFNFATRGGPSDIDDTAAALEALGSSSPRRAIHFIEAHENSDGGFPTAPRSPSNAQSTAWAVQGLLATGTSSASLSRPLAYLRALTAPDGHVRYARASNQTPAWVTAEALMALEEKPLPIAPVSSPASSATTKHARAASHAHKAAHKRAARSRRRPRVSAPSPLQTFATAVGFAEAVLLAPIGG